MARVRPRHGLWEMTLMRDWACFHISSNLNRLAPNRLTDESQTRTGLHVWLSFARWLGTTYFKADKISERDILAWLPAIAFLYLFLFHYLSRLTSFPSENKYRLCYRDLKALNKKDVNVHTACPNSWHQLSEINTFCMLNVRNNHTFSTQATSVW